MIRINNIILESLHNHKHMLADIRYETNGIKKPIVLFIHGFKGFKDWGHFNLIADYFADNGFVYSKINLSHNGTTLDQPEDFADLEAFGNNNFSIELDDIGVMIDLLQSEENPVPEKEIDKNTIYLTGHSRGGGMIILKAAEDRRIKGIATWAAISELLKIWPEEVLQQWEKDGVFYIFNSRTKQNMPLYYQLVQDVKNHPDRLNIPQAAASITCPWLICHGTEDESLPLTMATDLKLWNKNVTLFIIENAGHTFGGKHPYEIRELPPDSKKLVEETKVFFDLIR